MTTVDHSQAGSGRELGPVGSSGQPVQVVPELDKGQLEQKQKLIFRKTKNH